MPIADYLSLLRHGGTFVLVGAPENGAALKVQPFQLIMSELRGWGGVGIVFVGVSGVFGVSDCGNVGELVFWRSGILAFRLSGCLRLALALLVSAVSRHHPYQRPTLASNPPRSLAGKPPPTTHR